jgi:hypothetical protein
MDLRRDLRVTSFQGACHCGGVRFRIDHRPDELTTCDCSLCAMRGAVMAKVPEAALAMLEGGDLLTLYEWNSRVAKHYFCGRCGIYVFHRKRAAPDHYGVNARCLAGLDLDALPLRATEGANMTVTDAQAQASWPGPRISSDTNGGPFPGAAPD